AAAYDIEVAVSSTTHLRAVVAAAPGTSVHLHLDTGLARDGAEPSAWAALCLAARRAERAGLIQVVGVMGHLPCAATPGHQANAIGRTRFEWGIQIARAAGLRPR